MQTQTFPFSPSKKADFPQRPSRPEKTTCDKRGSSNAESLEPTEAGAGDHRRSISSEFPAVVSKMGEVVQFIPKRELDRALLIQEARAIYEGIFPTEKRPASLQRGPKE